MTGSKKFKLNSEDDLRAILKALIYSGGSALVLTAISILPQIDIPASYMWLVPIVNTLLVMAKKFFSDTR